MFGSRCKALAAAASLLLLSSHAGLSQQADAEPPMAPAEEPAMPALMAPTPTLVSPPAPAAEEAPVPTPELDAATAPAPEDVEPMPGGASSAAAALEIADIFSKVGDQIYEDCIFELSEEQVAVQAALILSYTQKGATSAVARQLAATQIQPPKLSEKCEQVRRTPEVVAPDWTTTTQEPPPAVKKGPVVAETKRAPAAPEPPSAPITLVGKKVLPQWDCADGVDYVTIKLNGYERKLTGGEICSPFEDVVHEVPASAGTFRLGYTIATGRLFVISDNAAVNGKTIAWGLSGRDVCRNNPDPDCFAAKAIGPLPPGEYTLAATEPAKRVSWGPRTKRHVVAIYLRKLWNKERFSAAHLAGIAKRGNIAIHVRLKGEMSEACIGLEQKGWAYVASLVKEGRVTGLDVHIDEPHPQIAEAPPVIVASSFSLTSLFK
jgi:hypothetical protein